MAVQMDTNNMPNIYGNTGTLQSNRPAPSQPQPSSQAVPPVSNDSGPSQPAVVTTLSSQGLEASRGGTTTEPARVRNQAQTQAQAQIQTQAQPQNSPPPAAPPAGATTPPPAEASSRPAPAAAASQPAITPPANPEPQPQGMKAAQQSRIDKIV